MADATTGVPLPLTITYPAELRTSQARKALKHRVLNDNPEMLTIDSSKAEDKITITNLLLYTEHTEAWHSAICAHYQHHRKRGICNGRQIVIKNEDRDSFLTVNAYHNGTIMFQGSEASLSSVQQDFSFIKALAETGDKKNEENSSSSAPQVREVTQIRDKTLNDLKEELRNLKTSQLPSEQRPAHSDPQPTHPDPQTAHPEQGPALSGQGPAHSDPQPTPPAQSDTHPDFNSKPEPSKKSKTQTCIPADTKIIILMDSNGKFLNEQQLFPDNKVAKVWCARTTDALQLLTHSISGKPDHIIIHTGTNDLRAQQERVAEYKKGSTDCHTDLPHRKGLHLNHPAPERLPPCYHPEDKFRNLS
ncbi:hypothetical protein SRHO_G00188770 [Serrasalmus rhombeus]